MAAYTFSDGRLFRNPLLNDLNEFFGFRHNLIHLSLGSDKSVIVINLISLSPALSKSSLYGSAAFPILQPEALHCRRSRNAYLPTLRPALHQPDRD